LYYAHVGGGREVSIGEAWDSWSWLQVGFRVCPGLNTFLNPKYQT
jgi:hypothetical protein